MVYDGKGSFILEFLKQNTSPSINQLSFLIKLKLFIIR
jgi:hypothetical protein